MRGHRVTHTYPLGNPGPKGRLDESESDTHALELRPIQLSHHFKKYSACRRFAAQRTYARDLRCLIKKQQPDVILSGNAPIDVQAELLWHCRQNRIGFVHWVQDVYCQALEFFLRTKTVFAKPISSPFRKLEKHVAAQSDATVVIAPAFRQLMLKWGIPDSKIEVIENWAPLDEISLHPRQNAWRGSHGFDCQPVFLYSGTLGLKHRPDLLYLLAKELEGRCTVVVVTEGVGRQYLDSLPRLDNLVILDFQPYERLSEVLASADVLLATLEAGAGQFAVPSKILTYLCAGRPILFAGPKENLAASVIERSGAGLVIDPKDQSGWIAAGRRLASDEVLRRELARNARAYAERSFDIEQIADKFEQILARSRRAPRDRVCA